MAFNKDIPTAGTSLRASNPQILENQESAQEAINNEHMFSGTDAGTQTGDHTQGSARCFFAATAPAVRIDTTNFIVTDNGSLWVNSDDNALSIMTDYSQAVAADKWTLVSDDVIAILLASNRVFAGTLGVDGNFTVGTGSQFTVGAAAGVVSVGSTLSVTGSVVPTSYSGSNGGFKDEDDMDSNSGTVVSSQQSIKAFGEANGYPELTTVGVGTTRTAIFTKYIIGDLDGDTSTTVVHGISGIDNILHVSATVFNSTTSQYQVYDYRAGVDTNRGFILGYDGTSIRFSAVDTQLQGNKFRVKIDYK